MDSGFDFAENCAQRGGKLLRAHVALAELNAQVERLVGGL